MSVCVVCVCVCVRVNLLLFCVRVICDCDRVLGCPKKHESRQMNLQMKILDPFDINMKPEFFQEFWGTYTL